MDLTQEAKEDALLLKLYIESGAYSVHDAIDEIVAGCRSNHSPDDISDAANGDVAALVRLRQAFGLPIFS